MADVCSIIRDHLVNCRIADEKHIVLSFEDYTADELISITQTKEDAPILTYNSGYAVLRPHVVLRVRSADRDRTWQLVSMISAVCHNKTVGGIRMFRLTVRDGGILRIHPDASSPGVESFLVTMEFRCLTPNTIFEVYNAKEF